MKKQKYLDPEREVRIDHKTTILTRSKKPDDEVRKEYIDKLQDYRTKTLKYLNKPAFGKET